MDLKKIVAMGMISLPLVAQATGLALVNETNYDSSSIINNGGCSSAILGLDGISRAHSRITISDFQMRLACGKNKTACRANIYMTSHCTGPMVATVVFNLSSGVVGIQNYHINNIVISGNGFEVRATGS